MTADQPLVCPKCKGVVVVARATAYTPARGRLIIAHGYCPGTCSDVEHDPGHDQSAEIATTPQEPAPAGGS
ncbi:hypothetical protein [Nonomuraea indica]|uniref:Small CPxCG-related zinc finger protein n=1 Tax=Nonomuraea indica TaxID=1581193 RepID=A0ABW8A7F8_9ACTN